MRLGAEADYKAKEAALQNVIDFPKIMAAFEKAGTGVAFVEQDECFERDPFDCLKMSYDYLKSIGYN